MANSIYAIRQQIQVGSQFDGTLPNTTPVNNNGVWTYPEDNNGGLFDLTDGNNPMAIYNFQAYMGGAPMTAWSLDLVDAIGSFPLISGTNETYVLWTPTTPAILLPSQTLEFSTTASNKQMYAVCVFSRAAIGE